MRLRIQAQSPLSTRTCDGCRFCCWSFNVDVPVPSCLSVLEPKRELSHCAHECAAGCALHNDDLQPDICHNFRCPYIHGQPIHKPDVFQELLEAAVGNMGNYIPAVSSEVPIANAHSLIQNDRSLPAYILVGNDFGGRWIYTILPLDKNADGGWETNVESVAKWSELYRRYGVMLPLEQDGTAQIAI